MADLIELYEKARLLNLQNLAHGKIDLNQEIVSNIDYHSFTVQSASSMKNEALLSLRTASYPDGSMRQKTHI